MTVQEVSPDDSLVLRGAVPVPSWTVAVLGAIVVSSGTGYFAWRARRARRTIERPSRPSEMRLKGRAE